MKLIPVYSNSFLKDLKLCKKRKQNIELLSDVIEKIITCTDLPAKNKKHKLTGNFKNCWECHIQPDWLLIWFETDTEAVFTRIGSHADLF